MARVSMTRTRVWPRILEHVPRLLWNKSIHAAWWSYDIWISQCHLDMMMTGEWCQRVRHQQGWSRNYRVKDRIFLKMYFHDFLLICWFLCVLDKNAPFALKIIWAYKMISSRALSYFWYPYAWFDIRKKSWDWDP